MKEYLARLYKQHPEKPSRKFMRHLKRIAKNLLIGMVCAGVLIAVCDVLGLNWRGAERALFVIGGIAGAFIGEVVSEHTCFNL